MNMYRNKRRISFSMVLLFSLVLLNNLFLLEVLAASDSPFDPYIVYASERIGADEYTRLYCLTSETENTVLLSVARIQPLNQPEILAMTKPILTYQQFLEGKKQMLLSPDFLRTYFSYESENLKINFIFEEQPPNTYYLRRGEYITNREIITVRPDEENAERIVVAPLTWPQIKWPCNRSFLRMDGFDFTHVLDICRDALKYLDDYTDSHAFEDNSEALYEIIW